MIGGRWPDPVPFDPGAAGSRHAVGRLLAAARDPATLLLVAGETTRRAGRGGPAAVAVAAALAAQQRNVLLVDLDLTNPSLHDLLLEPNEEGIADVLLFGASIDHVTHRAAERAFALITTGPFVPDAEEVLEHDGWSRALERFEASGQTVLLYVPATAPGLESLARRVGRIVFLGSVDEAELARASLPPESRVLAVLEPLAPVPAAPLARHAAEAAAPPDIGDASVESMIHVVPSEEASAGDGGEPRAPPPPGWPPAPGEREVLLPEASADQILPPGRRPRLPIVAIAIVLLIGLVFGAWYFGRRYFGDRETAADLAAADASANGLPGDPVGVLLPYSVAIEAHQDLGTATARVDTLAGAEPGIGFFIAPILVDSALYYRIMAGPVRDSAAAAVLMRELVSRGHKTGGSEWDIRATPFAFLMGAFDTRAEAETRLRELRALSIPAYVMDVPYSSGRTRYHLYSGAFAGAAEADVMRQLLANAGLPDTLVERTGRPPS